MPGAVTRVRRCVTRTGRRAGPSATWTRSSSASARAGRRSSSRRRARVVAFTATSRSTRSVAPSVGSAVV